MKEFVLYFSVVGVTVLLLGCSALTALFWAIKSGQFRFLKKNSKSIFDADENEGKVTDTFPSKNKSRSRKVLVPGK